MDDSKDTPPPKGLSRRTLISTALAAGVSVTALNAFGISASDVAHAAGRYGTVVWPCKTHPTPTGLQVYGSYRAAYPGGHKGSDYGIATGTSVVAISSGVVSLSDRNGIEGNYITILHDNGIRSHCIHLSQRDVQKGARVAAGQQIGLSGEDGSAAEGPHLHIEIYEGSARYDPDAWLKANVGPGNSTPTPTPKKKDSDMILIQSPGRGIAVIGPHYYRSLAAGEELDCALAAWGNPIGGNDRQFDIWRHLALTGASS
jgi:hypothetical protein